MPQLPDGPLDNIKPKTLKAVADVLATMYPPVTLTGVSQLGTEAERLKLALAIGKASVVDAIQRSLAERPVEEEEDTGG